MSPPFALLAALLAAAPACKPDPSGAPTAASAKGDIDMAERAWAASIGRNEAAFLERAAARDFIAVFDGQVLSRAALIAGAQRRRPGSASDTLTELRVHPSGAIAVAEGAELWSERAPRSRRRIVFSDLWVHCAGAWRLATSTAVSALAP